MNTSVTFCMSDCEFEGYMTVTYSFGERQVVVLDQAEARVFQVVEIDESGEVCDYAEFERLDYANVLVHLQSLGRKYGFVAIVRELCDWVLATANN